MHVCSPSSVSTYFHCTEANTNCTDLSPVIYALSKLTLMLTSIAEWLWDGALVGFLQLINQAETRCWKRLLKSASAARCPSCQGTEASESGSFNLTKGRAYQQPGAKPWEDNQAVSTTPIDPRAFFSSVLISAASIGFLHTGDSCYHIQVTNPQVLHSQ